MKETVPTPFRAFSSAELSPSKSLSPLGSTAPRGGKGTLIGSVEEQLHEADALSQAAPSRYLRRVKK